MTLTENLRSASYIEVLPNVYSVKPDLHRLGTDFGNGTLDERIFQIDGCFDVYLSEKLKCRDESFKRYSNVDYLSNETNRDLVKYMTSKLSEEYPLLFEVNIVGKGLSLKNKITGENILFDENMNPTGGKYFSSLDALACQVQEDLAVMQVENNSNKFVAGHICFPSNWAFEDKIGRDFSYIHMPVPKINPVIGQQIVEAMSSKGPFVRFVFGLSEDSDLNHHPSRNLSDSQIKFDRKHPKLFLRIERQVTSPLQKVKASLFTIRPYIHDCLELSKERKFTLANFIDSMTMEQLQYKGLFESKNEIVGWFRE